MAPHDLTMDGVTHPVAEPGARGSTFCERTGMSTAAATAARDTTGGQTAMQAPVSSETCWHFFASSTAAAPSTSR